MKINFSTELLSLTGEPLKAPEGMKLENLDLKTACVEALMFNEQGQGGKEKFDAYKLAHKISHGGEVECTAEEISLIKSKVGLAWGANVVGPAWTLLEA